MKKTFFLLKSIFLCVLIVLLVNAPALKERFQNGTETKSEQLKEQAIEAHTIEERVVSMQKEPDDDVEQQAEEKLLLQEAQADSYAYQMLSEKEQAVYIEILWALLEFQDNVKLSTVDSEEIAYVFQCVLNDHPEIFYVDGYTYTQYAVGDMLKKITFTGNYKIDRDEIVKRQAQIDEYVDRCLSGLSADADEYETVKYVYEYLIDHTEYDASVEDNQNICSVFLDGRSVCQGYAKATQYLLKQSGIRSTLVLGNVSGGEGHAWNMVQIDGEWYFVDTTWGDASYQAVGGQDSYPKKAMPTINYDYLCVTTKQLCTTHVIENIVELPECTSMENNYYVREGLYLTTLDKEQLERIFQNGYEKGSAYITLKCSSEQLYKQLQEMLITEQNIFYYLDCPDGVVSYTDSEEQYSMSFWL